MKKNSILKAGAVLVLSGIVVKFLGAVYRIPLTRMLGATQMGRYSAVFSLFMPFFSVATAGIVPCISRFTAWEKGDKNRLKTLSSTAAKLYISQAVAMAVIFVVFGWLWSLYQQDRLYLISAVILSPAIVFAAAENICKGITQGRMDMLPTAVANVTESAAKTAMGLFGVYMADRYLSAFIEDAKVKAALMAVTVAGGICLVYLIKATARSVTDKNCINNSKEKDKDIQPTGAKQLYAMSFPIAASAFVISVSGFFDTAVCLPRIEQIPSGQIIQSFKGASFKNAQDLTMYLLGVYQGMVQTVFNLVPAVLSYLGTAALPVVSHAVTAKNKNILQRQVTKLFGITAGISLPATVYIYLFKADILSLLFGTNAAQTEVASQLLSILLCGGVYCCFTSVLNSVLYAMGHSSAVFRILIAASLIKCTANYLLCGVPQINIKAFAVSAVLFYTIIFVLSIVEIKRMGVRFEGAKIFIMPTVATAFSAVSVQMITPLAFCSLPLVLKVVFSAVIYLFIYLFIGIITGFLLISPPENSNI